MEERNVRRTTTRRKGDWRRSLNTCVMSFSRDVFPKALSDNVWQSVHFGPLSIFIVPLFMSLFFRCSTLKNCLCQGRMDSVHTGAEKTLERLGVISSERKVRSCIFSRHQLTSTKFCEGSVQTLLILQRKMHWFFLFLPFSLGSRINKVA